MKYLKLFENHDKLSDYYQQISHQEGFDITVNNKSNFSDGEIELLKRKFEIPGRILYPVAFTIIQPYSIRVIKELISSEYTTITFNIIKISDDYFIVDSCERIKGKSNPTTIYYKCDQMDGLIKLIEDKAM